jgi:hypothetical protein
MARLTDFHRQQPPPAPPSPSHRQDLGSSYLYPPTLAFASSLDQAASTRSDLPNKQLHYIKQWFDDLVPLDLDRELLQLPATTFKSSFGRSVCTSNGLSIRLQPMLSTVFHLAVRAPGASTAVRRRARHPSPLCCCCCVLLV